VALGVADANRPRQSGVKRQLSEAYSGKDSIVFETGTPPAVGKSGSADLSVELPKSKNDFAGAERSPFFKNYV
jgi:hypothetical protein